jgi:hypothetical protein
MELIAELTGEHPRSEFGFQAASLDFNGDGIDDLVVGAHRWDPEYPGWPAQANPWGKIYFYLGPLGINNTVDFTISGYDSLKNLGNHLENLGDMNSDGYEDLGYFSYYYDPDEDIGHQFANILLGNTEMDSIPDYTYEFVSSEGFQASHTPRLKWLDDINGDGYDDAGFVISKRLGTNEEEDWVYLIYGNDFELHYFCQFDFSTWWTSINGIGDVNNDGFGDFIIGHDEYGYITKQLYFGGAENDSIPDMILTDMIPYPYYDTTGGIAIGDWNGDGIDDFNVGIDYYGPDIWVGSETTLQQQMHLEFYDWLVNRNNDFGDLNADGKDDFVTGIHYVDGNAYVYLGCQNGTCDYNIQGEYGVGLGWSVAIGDFNNNNCYDIALGGTGHYASGMNNCWCGKVYIYAGNPFLEEADPNIAVEEEVVPKPVVVFNAYPNPFNPTVSFEIKVEGYDNLQIEIYNIKGQKVETIPCHTENFDKLRTGSVEVRQEVIWNAEKQPSGIYFCKLVNVETDYILSVKKVTLLK